MQWHKISDKRPPKRLSVLIAVKSGEKWDIYWGNMTSKITNLDGWLWSTALPEQHHLHDNEISFWAYIPEPKT